MQAASSVKQPQAGASRSELPRSLPDELAPSCLAPCRPGPAKILLQENGDRLFYQVGDLATWDAEHFFFTAATELSEDDMLSLGMQMTSTVVLMAQGLRSKIRDLKVGRAGVGSPCAV
jgi:hypothetical protein